MTNRADENGPVNARRLMAHLVRLGVEPNVALRNAWVTAEALEGLGLDGEALDAALTFAGGEEWIDTGPQAGTIVLTDEGVKAGQV